MYITQEFKEKLIEKISKFIEIGNANDCFKWNGAIGEDSYPRISFNGKTLLAHRAAWLCHFGSIPQFKYIRHTCNNRWCTNPSHLYLSSKKGPFKKRYKVRLHRKRLAMDLPFNIVEDLKKIAKKRNVTMTKYMIILILNAIKLESSYE